MKFNRLLALVIILALVVSMAAPAALAAPAKVNSFEEFMAADCEQFTFGVDSNWYTHTKESFGSNYALSDELTAQLIALEPINSFKLPILQFRENGWGGSCYGVATTMVLNRLTKSGMAAENGELHIENFQPGAENYFDLGNPQENPRVLDMINYYMLSQLLSWSEDSSTSLFVAELDLDGDFVPDPLDDAAYEKYGLTTPEEYIDEIKGYVDNGQPFLFCYFYSAGGHAIVGLDYFEDDNGTPNDPTDDVFYVKTFDENDVDHFGDAEPACSYLEIKKGPNGKYDPLSANIYYASGPNGEYEPLPGLHTLQLFDMRTLNSYLNIENPVMPEVDVYYYPTMTIHNINEIADDLSITVTKDGVDTIITFYRQDGFVTPAYSDPTGDRPVNSFTYDLIIEGIASATIEFDEADAFTVSYTGEDALYLSMGSAGHGNEGGTYSSIGAINVAAIEFDGLGQFQQMVAQSGKSLLDSSLFVGTLGDEFSTDMMSIYMPECTYIEMYDWLDHYQFDESIYLHSDGFQVGMDLLFYDGLNVIEEPLSVYSDDDRDTWVKMRSQSYGATAFITLWSAFETEDGSFPTFRDMPDMTGWVGEMPKDGWVALSSGHYIYLQNGEPVTGPITMISNIEEHSYLLDENGFMYVGAVPTETGYDYYNADGSSPMLDSLGQLLYRAEIGEGTVHFTFPDWVSGNQATIVDETVGIISILDNGDGTFELCDVNYELIDFTANEDGSLSFTSAGETPVDVTISFIPNKYTITNIFSDITTSAWYSKAVKYVYANNLMTGISESLFGPNEPSTRGDMLCMLYNVMGDAELPENAPTFDDVPADHPAYTAIIWAMEKGIAEPLSETTFGINEPLVREQMAVYLYLFFGAFDLLPEEPAEPVEFSDSDQISENAREAMDWATAYGVFEGCDNNMLHPQDIATRAECATMAERITTYLLLLLFGLV